MAKERVDIALARRGLAESREKAKIMIMLGEVYVNGERIRKVDRRIDPLSKIEIKKNALPFVGFGGIKLEGAIRYFSLPIEGKTVIDIGSSTGGFVDCLLKYGAKKVYAIDVGKNLLHEKLRKDTRVVLKEGTNARYLQFEDIGELVDLITIDVSFISLRKLLPVAKLFLKQDGILLSLLKPQFEVGRHVVGKGGIVRDKEKIEEAIEKIRKYGEGIGLSLKGIFEAERERMKKNREFFLLWEFQKDQSP